MDRKGIVGVAVCTALLMLWYWHMAANAPRRPPPGAVPPVEEVQEPGTPGGEDGNTTVEPGDGDQPRVGGGEPEPPDGTEDGGGGVLGEGNQPPVEQPLAPQPLPTDVLSQFGPGAEDTDPVLLASGDVAECALDPGRGGCRSVTLLKYLESGSTQSIALGDVSFPFLASAWTSASGGDITVRIVEQGEGRLVLERTLPGSGLVFTESWETPVDQEYRLRYGITCRNTGENPADLSNVAVACGQMALEPGGASGGKMGRAGMTDLAIDVLKVNSDKPSTFTPKKIGKIQAGGATSRDPVQWVAVHNKYFLFYVSMADNSFSGFDVGLGKADDGNSPPVRAVAYLPGTVLGPGEEASFALDAYSGPKEFRRLRDIGGHLERIMRMDLFFFFRPKWMAGLTSFILRTLIRLNETFNHKWGYGFAIIVITFVIKMLFWPLTHRSTVSMRKMQKLQPLIQEIRSKYKDQPQKTQQKTMELYREHKVNPLGGCLPILFQIPVFFALFNTFRSAIELRQAEFMWVADLSQPDTLPFITAFPVRPLAILMGVTMILQQVTTPTSGDPQQKRMMTFMTVFFMFIFYGMPAGLTLYWAVNQILTLIQNVVSRRLDKDGHGATA